MAHCSQPLLSRLVQHRFRCTSGPRHRRSAMRSGDRLQVQTSSGWMDIGNRLVTITGGSGDAGTVLHMKGHTGAIRIMTTIAKAGECTRDIGTMRTTTMAAGETMIMIATIMIATVTTDVPRTRQTFNRADIHAGFDQPDVGRLPGRAPTHTGDTTAQ